MNEAAAAARTDSVQFRLQRTTDERVAAILKAVALAAGWQERPSLNPRARNRGSEPATGSGVCIMVRAGGYWAAVAEITVTPDSGAIQLTKVYDRSGLRQDHKSPAARTLHERGSGYGAGRGVERGTYV